MFYVITLRSHSELIAQTFCEIQRNSLRIQWKTRLVIAGLVKCYELSESVWLRSFLRPYRIVSEETYFESVRAARTLEAKLMITFKSLKNSCDLDPSLQSERSDRSFRKCFFSQSSVFLCGLREFSALWIVYLGAESCKLKTKTGTGRIKTLNHDNNENW